MLRGIDGTLVLDTHVWIWAVEGVEGKLSSSTLGAINKAAVDGRLYVSAISVWEIGILLNKERLALSIDFGEWLQASRRPPGVLLQSVTPEIAADSVALPGSSLPGDPADRIIVATARALNAVLVTCDRRILDYGSMGHISIHDPTP